MFSATLTDTNDILKPKLIANLQPDFLVGLSSTTKSRTMSLRGFVMKSIKMMEG